jgi:hypothetical protein
MLKKAMIAKAQTKKAKRPAPESGTNTATFVTTEEMLFAVMAAPMLPIFHALR